MQAMKCMRRGVAADAEMCMLRQLQSANVAEHLMVMCAEFADPQYHYVLTELYDGDMDKWYRADMSTMRDAQKACPYG